MTNHEAFMGSSSLLWILMIGVCASSNSPPTAPAGPEAEVRKTVEAAIAKSLEATRKKDIDAFIAGISDDLVLRDDAGHRITKRQLKANILRDWKIIVRTVAIEEKIDSLKLDGPTEATVSTSQRWERLMLQKDGVTQDRVVTTQRHREAWHKTAQGWKLYKIEELGGKVWINGKPYQP